MSEERIIHNKLLQLCDYVSSDFEDILTLFYETVTSISAKDYTKKQLEAWTKIDKYEWSQSLLAHETVLVKRGDKTIGFGDLDGNYLDRLYIYKHDQNQGVATMLLKNLEQRAKKNGEKIRTHASITAKAFFQKQGYQLIKKQEVERGDQKLTNFIMEKQLE